MVVKRKGKKKMDIKIPLLIVAILLGAYILTNTTLLVPQAQYEIVNKIEASIYVYNEDGNLNSGIKPADAQITIQGVVDDSSNVVQVVGILYTSDVGKIGEEIQRKILNPIGDNKYESGFAVKELPSGQYFAKIAVTTTLDTLVEYSSEFSVHIKHPDVPMTYSFGVEQDGVLIAEGASITGGINVRLSVTTGVTNGGYLNLWKGSDYNNKVDSLVGTVDEIDGWYIDVSGLENGLYRFEGMLTGEEGWTSANLYFEFNVENPPEYEAVTGEMTVYQINADGSLTAVPSPGELHDSIKIEYKILTGEAAGISIDVYKKIFDENGILIDEMLASTAPMVYNAADNKWETVFDTRTVPNGAYRFEFVITRLGDGLVTVQSAFDTSFNSGYTEPQRNSTYIWLIAIGAVVVIVVYFVAKRRNSVGYYY